MGANNSNLKQAVKDEYNRVQSSGAKYLVRAPCGHSRPQRSQQPRQVYPTPVHGTAPSCSRGQQWRRVHGRVERFRRDTAEATGRALRGCLAVGTCGVGE